MGYYQSPFGLEGSASKQVASIACATEVTEMMIPSRSQVLLLMLFDPKLARDHIVQSARSLFERREESSPEEEKSTRADFFTSEDTECSVCWESLDDDSKISLPCGHLFHSACLRRWLLQQRTCPICRTGVLRS